MIINKYKLSFLNARAEHFKAMRVQHVKGAELKRIGVE